MANITFNQSQLGCKIKPMHAVNNAPTKTISFGESTRGTFENYKKARIPYARNHDAAINYGYGGEHCVDVAHIFTNFDADPENPENYDFTLTDINCKIIENAGTKVFYRLGSKIEHWVKKYNTLPPKDFKKWAIICEHIIRHYTEGWADGFKMDIEYWEIWNEANLPGCANWTGPQDKFYELFSVTARHLKEKFPHLKIGGPAMAGVDVPWAEGFFKKMVEDKVPIDFFTWHHYVFKPEELMEDAKTVDGLLKKYGYENAENICDEWNYIKDWVENYQYSINTMHSLKGAAFTAATMCACQSTPLDMLMYYDARPCVFNGIFDYYTDQPLKGYYPFPMFADLYEIGTECTSSSDDDKIYTLAAANSKGDFAAMICYYDDDAEYGEKDITINFSSQLCAEIYILSEDKDCEKIFEFNGNMVNLKLKLNEVLLIKTKA